MLDKYNTWLWSGMCSVADIRALSLLLKSSNNMCQLGFAAVTNLMCELNSA